MIRHCLVAVTPFALVLGVPVVGIAASPLRLQCDTTVVASGEYSRRTVTLDLDHGAVDDGRLHWEAGKPSPVDVAGEHIAFVRRNGNVVEWGSQDPITGETINRIMFDLATAAYAILGDRDALVRGRCHALPDGV